MAGVALLLYWTDMIKKKINKMGLEKLIGHRNFSNVCNVGRVEGLKLSGLV